MVFSSQRRLNVRQASFHRPARSGAKSLKSSSVSRGRTVRVSRTISYRKLERLLISYSRLNIFQNWSADEADFFVSFLFFSNSFHFSGDAATIWRTKCWMLSETSPLLFINREFMILFVNNHFYVNFPLCDLDQFRIIGLADCWPTAERMWTCWTHLQPPCQPTATGSPRVHVILLISSFTIS